MAEPFYYGGQGVIEGVMIRGRHYLALAVRLPNQELHLHSQPLPQGWAHRLRRFPFLRGIGVLAEALTLGTRSLLLSAQLTVGEEKISPRTLWLSLGLALAVGIGGFLLLPVVAVHWLPFSPWWQNASEGLLRLGMFLAYIWGVGFIPEVRRVFQYHGAEHKAINAFEKASPLEVSEVRKYSTAHPRCGTALLFWVLLLALVVFTLLGDLPFWLRLLSRLALLPVLASLGYEFLRLGASRARLLGPILFPALALQGLTTREPDDSELEVALAALKLALKLDEAQG